MDDAIETDPARVGLYLTFGVVLTVIGLIDIGIYAFTPRNTPAEGDGTADAAWQSAVIIGAALATGIGVLLLLWAVVARVRVRARGGDRS